MSSIFHLTHTVSNTILLFTSFCNLLWKNHRNSKAIKFSIEYTKTWCLLVHLFPHNAQKKHAATMEQCEALWVVNSWISPRVLEFSL